MCNPEANYLNEKQSECAFGVYKFKHEVRSINFQYS